MLNGLPLDQVFSIYPNKMEVLIFGTSLIERMLPQSHNRYPIQRSPISISKISHVKQTTLNRTHLFSLNLAKQQLLAAGDSNGTLHILEVPWGLRQPVNQELQCK